MKRLLSLLLPVLLLTGCFQTPPAEEPAPQEGILTSERVEELYREASEVYDWFTACSPPCVGQFLSYYVLMLLHLPFLCK